MDAEKIIQDLNRRFAAPLPEFYKRRIVVWIDEDQEFVDKLDEITLGGAKVVALTGTNNFYVKKLLAVDDPTSNYLVYRPFAYESDEDNWLLDVELYGEEFRPAGHTSYACPAADVHHGGTGGSEGCKAECHHQGRVAGRTPKGQQCRLSGICELRHR